MQVEELQVNYFFASKFTKTANRYQRFHLTNSAFFGMTNATFDLESCRVRVARSDTYILYVTESSKEGLNQMQFSRMLRIVGGTDSAPANGPGVDWITKTGMSLLVLGIAVSMAMLFFPVTTNFAADYLIRQQLGITGPSVPAAELAFCAALGIKTATLTSAGLIAQSLWLVGAVVLCIQPLRTKSYAFLVFELSMVLASLLPLLDMSFTSTVILRACFTGIVMIWLGTLEGMEICKAMIPLYWGKVWHRQMGDTALAVVGSEILCWGYALFGVNAALAWVALIAGSVVMMRFGWSAARSGVRIAIAWYYLNMIYVFAGAIQLLWLLKSA